MGAHQLYIYITFSLKLFVYFIVKFDSTTITYTQILKIVYLNSDCDLQDFCSWELTTNYEPNNWIFLYEFI